MQETIPSPLASRRRAAPAASAPEGPQSAPGPQRHDLIHRAAAHEAEAQRAAARGEIEASARQILLALDCERRAGSLGPQVLQVIKPRG